MEVLLVTVPTTGTTFTLRMFQDAGFEKVRIFPIFEPQTEGNTIRHAHCEYGEIVQMALDYASKMPLICTCRHPYTVEESWKRQGRPTESLLMCFEKLINDFAPLADYWLAVDSPLRERQLQGMCEGLGVALATDWEPVNIKGQTSDVDPITLSPSPEVRALVMNNQEFFDQFYGYATHSRQSEERQDG